MKIKTVPMDMIKQPAIQPEIFILANTQVSVSAPNAMIKYESNFKSRTICVMPYTALPIARQSNGNIKSDPVSLFLMRNNTD